MKQTYELSFIHLSKLRIDDLFLKRFRVYSREAKNDKHAIDFIFDLSFTNEDVRKLPIDDLLTYFEENKNELKKRLSFFDRENRTTIRNEEVLDYIINAMFRDEHIKKVFERTEDMFYGLRISEQSILNKSYTIDVIHQHKLKINVEDELFLLEVKGGGKNAEVDYFAYYYDIFVDPIPVFRFLPKEVEEKFFRDVLKKTLIRRLVAPLEIN